MFYSSKKNWIEGIIFETKFAQLKINYTKYIMITRILFLIISITQIILPQNYGSLRFTNYADDKKGAFSLTFDDGLLTHTQNVEPILNQYGFKGTFYHQHNL